jgi:tetratricopeptide (TPR) repeat protein
VASDREKILQAAQRYVDKKRYDRAIAEYQKIVQEDPQDARILLKIGDLQARMEAYPEAIATYDRVGQYYASQGFALKAIAVYKQIRELIRKHVPQLADRYGHIVPKLAEIYSQLGLTSDALAAYDEVATRFQRAGRDRDAIDIFGRMVELDANNPLPHLRLAEACCRVQALDDAVASFWNAADLLMKMERHDDALKVVERMLHFRQEPAYARIAAELYLRRGTREDALLALAKLQVCFQDDPKDLDTLALLAHAFNTLDQAAKALEVYKEMARIARDQNRRDLYEQLMAHLLEVAPHDDQVRALQSLPPPASAAPRQSSIPSLDDSEIEIVEDSEPPTREGYPPGRRPQVSSPEVVVVDEDFEAVEERVEPERFDSGSHTKKAIVDAESFRKLRLYSKSIEALQIALEIDPRSLPLRQKLREVLTDAGDRRAALDEGVRIAAIHFQEGRSNGAEQLLLELLESEPEHADALALLARVNPQVSSHAPSSRRAPGHARAEISSTEGYDPDAPLPSYDLEEISAAQAMAPDVSADLVNVDAPFGEVESPPDQKPLPSFPLPAPGDDLLEGLDAAGNLPPPAAAAESGEGLEEVLEEAEFFSSRGLHEDARSILLDQLARTPNHPLVLERLQEVEAALGLSGESGTIERSQLGSSPPDSDRAFYIAATLDAIDEAEHSTSGGTGTLGGNDEVDVDQVFAKFKEGVRAQVSENDSATHYDLGVAYKEMGLLSDAVSEFELASREPQRACMCFAMIGMIHLEQDQLDRAADAYVRALQAQDKTVEQEMSLYYDLGNVYDMKGEGKEALYYFKKIARRDPGYRDIQERILALEPPAAPQPGAARAVNDGDEFDRVFDELFDRR